VQEGGSSTRGRKSARAKEAHMDDCVDKETEEETEISNNAVNNSFRSY